MHCILNLCTSDLFDRVRDMRRVKLVAATNVYRSRDVKLVGYT